MSRRIDTSRIVTLVCTAILLAGCGFAAATALANLWSASLGRDGSSFALRSHLWIHEGLLAGLVAVLLFREPSTRSRVRAGALICAGAAVPGVVLLTWAMRHRLLTDMLDQVVTYNRLYAREAGASAISNLARGWGLEIWKIPGGVPLVVLTVCLGIIVLWKRHASGSISSHEGTATPLALFAGPSLVVIWSVESLSGRFWPHQLMTAAPLLVLLLAAVAAPAERTTLRITVWTTTVLSVLAIFSYSGWWASGNTQFRLDASRIAAVNFLKAASSPNDRLQVWGSEDLLHLRTGLLPATRYTYYYPLLTPGYATPQKTREFFSELERHRPRWVVTYGRDTTLSPSRARAPVLAAFSSWLAERGRPVRRFRNLIIWELSDRYRAPSPG